MNLEDDKDDVDEDDRLTLAQGDGVEDLDEFIGCRTQDLFSPFAPFEAGALGATGRPSLSPIIPGVLHIINPLKDTTEPKTSKIPQYLRIFRIMTFQYIQ